MRSNPADNIDEYIASFPDDVQQLLQQVRATIHAAAPDAQEAIKYGIPTFTLKGNLVHFGGYKKQNPLPLDLVTRIVQYRVMRQLEKAKK